jgi:glycosyltransferase involved in cell wall biosynthesis
VRRADDSGVSGSSGARDSAGDRSDEPHLPPLRIAVIAPPWVPVPPPAYGGTESVLDTLCRGLVGAGHQVLLVGAGDSTCPVERTHRFETSLGIAPAGPIAEVVHAAFGHEAADRWGADIVHDHTLSGPALGSFGERPVVTTCHGPFTGDLAPVYRLMSQDVPLIAISRSQAAECVGIRVAAVIHHGVDVASHPTSDRIGDFALFLGRMSPDKGIDVAIEAARTAGIPLLIGAKMREPLERQYFDEVIRPQLGGEVEYIGELDRRALLELLPTARCLLNPIQWNEPFGLVAIEALAAGVPVLATPNGAMPEIVVDGRTGFVRESVEELADALERVDVIDRRECRAHAVTCFSMERMAADHVRFFRQVLDAPSRRRCR